MRFSTICKPFMHSRPEISYDSMVRNFDFILNILDINMRGCILSLQSHLYSDSYATLKTGLIESLEDGGIKYSNGRKVKEDNLIKLIDSVMNIKDTSHFNEAGKVEIVKKREEKLIELVSKLKLKLRGD